MLNELEQKQFMQVCWEHIWSAIGMHVTYRSAGSESQASAAVHSVRELIHSAPAYRECWDRIKPTIRAQGFRSFISMVETKAAASAEVAVATKIASQQAPARRQVRGGAAVAVSRSAETFVDDANANTAILESPAMACRPNGAAAAQVDPRARDTTWVDLDVDDDSRCPLAKLRFLSGKLAGREVLLSKELTQLGRRGTLVVAITRREEGYSIVCVEAGRHGRYPVVNGTSIGPTACPLHDKDIVQIAGINARFLII